MKKNLLGITILLFCINTFSQNNYYEKKGIVLSKIDSTSLPYVNIFSDIYKIGTVTNELGEFLLSIPDTITNKIITFSSLGYLTKKISIDNINDIIYLSPSTEILNEVFISNNTPKFEKLVDSIYDRLKDNYSNKRHLLKAFYRQTTIKDSSYLRIIEADIDIQEYGITKQLDRDRIKVNQYRRSDDKMSTRYKKNWELASKLFGEKNELVWVKKEDFINNFAKTKEHTFYHKNILNSYNFTYEYSTAIDNNQVYVFSFYMKSLKNVPLLDNQLSKIYINAKDFAVLKVEKVSGFKRGNTFHNFQKKIYHYAKVGKYYYLTSIFNYVIFENKEIKIDKLHTYEIITDRDDYEKIKRKEVEKINKDFSTKDYKYDSIFWKNYKILPEVPLIIKMQSLIEIEKKLNNQYLDNSNGKK